MDRLDQQLVADYIAGDEKSLEILIKRYLKPIYSFVCRYIGNSQDAEDITQEVFMKVWRNLKKFDQQKSFKTWIFSIAKNTSIDWIRKKKAIPFSNFENEEGKNLLTETLADSAPLPNEIFERACISEMLNTAMSQLAPKYRMVLFLRYNWQRGRNESSLSFRPSEPIRGFAYNDHFNFREIAEAFGESIHTTKSRHRRALIQLKKLLTEA